MRSTWLIFPLLTGSFLAFAAPVAADESEEDEDTEEETTTVTTTTRAPLEEFMADRSVGVIDEEEVLARQASSVGDALGEEPGIFWQATNRGSDSVYMRGLIGPENLILVDGIRFNQSTFRTGPNQYLATLDPWGFDRMEAVRGPGSVLYGSGAMGGVVQGFPRPFRDDSGFGGRLITHYSSADHTFGGALDLDGRAGDFAGTVGGSHREHHALRPGSRGGEDLFLAAEQQGRMLASEYRQSFWRAGGEVELSDEMDLQLRYMGGQIDDARRTDQLGRGQMRSADNRDDLAWAKLTRQDFSVADEFRAFAAYHRSDELTRRYQCQTEDIGEAPRVVDLRGCAELSDHAITERRDLRDRVHTAGAGLSATSYLPIDLTLTYGAEGYRDFVESTRSDVIGPAANSQGEARGNFADGSTYTTAGAFVHGDYSLWYSGMHEVSLGGGGRVEHFRALAPEVTDEIGDVQFANTGLVGALGISYFYDTNLNIYLNWNQGFRAPNLQESTVLGDTGNFYEVPNPELGPERNDTFELGTRVESADIGHVSTGLFATIIGDRITRAPTELNGQSEIDDKPVQHRVNADRAYFYGAELQGRTAPQWGVSLFGNIAWIDGAVGSDEDDPDFQAGPLHGLFEGDHQWTNPRRLPPLQYLLGLRYEPETNWSITFFAQGKGSQDKLSSGDFNDLRICESEAGVLHDRADCPGTPGWTTFNLRGAYRPNEILTLDLSATNLTDQRYQYHGSGVFGPGLQVMATATMRGP